MILLPSLKRPNEQSRLPVFESTSSYGGMSYGSSSTTYPLKSCYGTSYQHSALESALRPPPYRDILFDPVQEESSITSNSNINSEYFYLKTLYKKQVARAAKSGVLFDAVARSHAEERERDAVEQRVRLQQRVHHRQEEARKNTPIILEAHAHVAAPTNRIAGADAALQRREQQLDERKQRLDSLLARSSVSRCGGDDAKPALQSARVTSMQTPPPNTLQVLEGEHKQCKLLRQDLMAEDVELHQRILRIEHKIVDIEKAMIAFRHQKDGNTADVQQHTETQQVRHDAAGTSPQNSKQRYELVTLMSVARPSLRALHFLSEVVSSLP
jgi:hypothetical protein